MFLHIMRYFLFALLCLTAFCCVHDQFIKDAKMVFLNDLDGADSRLLQQSSNYSNIGGLRIYADYTQVSTTDGITVNLIKRMVNISTLLFYNVLSVQRLDILYYPSSVSTNCNGINVPNQYVTNGVNRTDIGIIIADQVNNTAATYIAKSAACAFLSSTNRPIWGVMVWNDLLLKFDQEGFQEIVYVAAHQLTHILGFSAMMYSLYPAGNPVVNSSTGNYLNSSKLNREVADHFGCTNNQGMLLEDQDGTLLASHWERNTAFNDYMTASNSKNTVFSRFTLALLDSTGWYTSVDYSYAQPMMWGKGKGCRMLNISDCSSSEFCQTTGFSCDFDGTGIGACRTDIFSNNCTYSKYYTNTMCIDPSYTAKNLNAAMSASEAGGWNSRCFSSNFRKPGLTATSLNFRCYTFKCAEDQRSLFIQVGNAVLKCSSPGQVLNAPFFLTGTLTCPTDFSLYCAGKKTCTNNCNINGICLDGKCLCTGMNYLQKSCQNVDLTVKQVNDTAGLLFAISLATVSLGNEPNLCFDGYVYQAEFGQCIPCSKMYNCNRCTPSGCTVCNNGAPPNINGYC